MIPLSLLVDTPKVSIWNSNVVSFSTYHIHKIFRNTWPLTPDLEFKVTEIPTYQRFLVDALMLSIWKCSITSFSSYCILKLGCPHRSPAWQAEDNTPSAFYGWWVKRWAWTEKAIKPGLQLCHMNSKLLGHRGLALGLNLLTQNHSMWTPLLAMHVRCLPNI